MMDVSKFKDIFLMEAEEHIQKMNNNILSLEKIYSDEGKEKEIADLLNELMRSSHTIKGSSASMNFLKLAFLTHVLEDIFDSLRNGNFTLTQDIVNKIFESIDLIEKSLLSIKENNEEADTDQFANDLKVLTGVETIGTGKSAKKNNDKASGQIKVSSGVDKSPKVENNIVENVNEEEIEASKISYIKVPVERLETLMDQVEELLIDKMRLEQLAIDNPVIKEVSDHVSLLISGIQFQVMQARLVPVEQVFARFPRMIRDLAKKQNKKIDFKMIGSEIELDRTIIDKLNEPLIHLLRNAADHGINEKGEITLKAVRESDNALIIVENNDQGIDYEKVRESAVRKGIVGHEEVKEYSKEQLRELLFHPQLSTRDVISEISGRGVGLSVVKSFAESLSGRVVIEDLDPGVRFSLELPLTLAIINSLLIKIGNSMFAIPFNNVDRSVKILKEDIKKMADRDVAIVDGVNIPLIRFEQVFDKKVISVLKADILKNEISDNKETEKAVEEKAEEGDVTAVIIKKDDESIGLVVDKLINVQEIIVKPLSSLLRDIKCFSGSTILGDGRVILILDILNLVNSVKF